MHSRIELHNAHTLTLGSCGKISCDLLGWTSQQTGSGTIHTQMVYFVVDNRLMPFSTGNGGQNFHKVGRFNFNRTEYDLQIL